MKTIDLRHDSRDNDPAKLRTWIGICTLTAGAYAAILLFSPGDQAQHEVVATMAMTTAPAVPPSASDPDPSVPLATQALAGVQADTTEPTPTF